MKRSWKVDAGVLAAPIVQAVHDQRSSASTTSTHWSKLMLATARQITYHRDRFCDHLLLHPLSAPMTLRWLRDRFDGRPLSEHRARTKWPTLFNPSMYLRHCSSWV